jgi:Ca2+-binding RTX toxin-like protein
MNGIQTTSSTTLLGAGNWSPWQTEQGGVVTGDGNGNTLTGTTGNDQLYGNAGNDTLSGGGGNDQFVFNTALNAGTNVDTITDFSRGADRVLLDHLIFTALGVGNLAAGSLVAEAGATAHDGNDYVLYDTTTGNLSYDPDGTGAGAATLFATLSTHPAISAGDLAVV